MAPMVGRDGVVPGWRVREGRPQKEVTGRLDTRLMVGVGAAFDLLYGRQRNAQRGMTAHGARRSIDGTTAGAGGGS